MIWYIIVPVAVIAAIVIVMTGVRTGWNFEKMKTALAAFGASIIAAFVALWQSGAAP